VTQPLPTDPPESAWGFTRTHRIGIAMLAGMLLVLLGIGYLRHPARLDDPVVIVDGKPLGLDGRIDPNTADVVSLSRLPHVSQDMALAIVRYRSDQATSTGDPVVYRTMADIARVKIGTRSISKATLDGIRPYLKLVDEPTTPAKPGSGKLIPPQLVPDTQPVEPDAD